VSCRSGSGTTSTSYTGGQVATVGKFNQTYGRFAVRAKFPASTIAGLESTLWLWPQDNVATGLTGEIDIAEEYSKHADRIIPCLHYPYAPATLKVTSTNPLTGTNVYTNNFFPVKDVNAFHEYAVEWDASTITIFIDGKVVLADRLATLGASPFDQPFFLALSGALGLGDNAVTQRTQLPATTQVDWVRAWK
jgi:beta-glucanase (GH16 family)